MPERYFKLSIEERRQILDEAFNRTGKAQAILEKDLWLVWTLKALFAIPDAPSMTFKGGTALSKVFGVIERFSEDADVTVNYTALDPSLLERDLSQESRNQRSKVVDELKRRLAEFTHGRVIPYLRAELARLAPDGQWDVTINDNGEDVKLYYPSALAQGEGYMLEYVLIELGGRNPIEPSSVRRVTTEIANVFPDLPWPEADVNVLEPTRTFWEKVTLIHVECNLAQEKDIKRKFRHWFDLVKLFHSPYGATALADKFLLKAVVEHKKIFYYSKDANYDACLEGGVRLVPGDAYLARLRDDYNGMVNEGMFFSEIPDFDSIMADVAALETAINTSLRPK